MNERQSMPVNESFVVPGEGASTVVRRLTTLMEQAGHQCLPVGPGSFELRRVRRLVRALPYPVRRTTCLATVLDQPTGTSVTVTGQFSDAELAALRVELVGSSRNVPAPAPPRPQLPSASQERPLVEARASKLEPGHAPPAPVYPASEAAASEQTVAGPRTPALGPALALVFDSGLCIPLAPMMLVGRNPAPSRPGDAAAQLLRVDDPTLCVSKTHLAVGMGRAGAWVEDRGSTNGTDVVRRSGETHRLESGRREVISAGTIVVFGPLTMYLRSGQTAVLGSPSGP